MSKYSSDSDSTDDDSRYQKRKSKRRSRSLSSSSSDSRYSSKKRSYKHKRSKGHRSRSRDKYSKSRSRHSRDESSRSTFGSQSSSKAKHSKSSRDRSSSRERSRKKHRSRRHSRSPSKSHTKYRSSSSSSSNGRSRSRSNSPISVDSRNTSQAGSARQEPSSEDQLRAKLQMAIKAAQSADDLLRQQGFLTGVSSRKDDIIKEPITNIIDEINNPGFIPKTFVSQSSNTFTSEVVPELQKTPSVSLPPQLPETKDSATSIFHPSLLVDTDQKLERWVKKLFNLRQKAINGEPIA